MFYCDYEKSTYNCGWRGKMNTREGQLVRRRLQRVPGGQTAQAFSHGKEFGASPHYNRVLLFLMILASSK